MADAGKEFLHLEIEADVVIGNGEQIPDEGNGRVEKATASLILLRHPMGEIGWIPGEEFITPVSTQGNGHIFPRELRQQERG